MSNEWRVMSDVLLLSQEARMLTSKVNVSVIKSRIFVKFLPVNILKACCHHS